MSIIDYSRDRSGTRHSDKYTITFEEEGESWSYGNSKKLRKLYASTGNGVVTLTIHGGVHGQSVQELGPSSSVRCEDQYNRRDKRITITCDTIPSSGISIYVHAEWNYNG